MPCLVPTCGATVGTFRLFPKDITLSERWLDAIYVGCGLKVAERSDNLNLMELCQWHFGKASDELLYQEPKIFFNCEQKKEIEIDSCRLCLRFYPSRDMASKNSELSGMTIKQILLNSLRLDITSDDFLKLICIECLARLELLKSIQKDFMDAEITFKHLVNIIQDNAEAICRTMELPSSGSMIMQEGFKMIRDDFSSESDDVIYAEDSSDEWAPPENKTSSLVKSKTSSCDDSVQPEVSFRDIISRKCYICQLLLEDANDLASHLTECHADVGNNRCAECLRDFPMLSTYNKHLSRHDATERPHRCSFCSICFKIKRTMLMHENTKHGTNHVIKSSVVEINKPTICEACGLSFTNLRKLRSHAARKHASKDKPKCKICGKTFTAQSSLERHMLVHTNEKPYVCSNCDAAFRRLLDLRYHVQKVHEGKNPHVCGECNREFNSYITLYNHKQFVHLNKPKPVIRYACNRKQVSAPRRKRSSRPSQFKCKLCNEIFTKNANLHEHISASHANESYPVLECPHCPRTFVSLHNLCMHKATHTDKCVCKECGKRFASFQGLKNHIASIHEQQNFDCPICQEKTYKSQSALQQHMTLHTKGKQFSCDFCDKSFNRKTQLTIHRRLHTGEKPFECPNCSMRFSDDGTFCKHKKRCLTTISIIEEVVGNAMLDS